MSTTQKELTVKLFVSVEEEEWDGEVDRYYKLLNKFELVDTDIPEEDLYGIGESWCQSDAYYVTIQNLIGAIT